MQFLMPGGLTLSQIPCFWKGKKIKIKIGLKAKFLFFFKSPKIATLCLQCGRILKPFSTFIFVISPKLAKCIYLLRNHHLIQT